MKENFLQLETLPETKNASIFLIPNIFSENEIIHAGLVCDYGTKEEKEKTKKAHSNYWRYESFNDAFDTVSINYLKENIDKFCSKCFYNISLAGNKSYEEFNLEQFVIMFNELIELTKVKILTTEVFRTYETSLDFLRSFYPFELESITYPEFTEVLNEHFKKLMPAYNETQKQKIREETFPYLYNDVKNEPLNELELKLKYASDSFVIFKNVSLNPGLYNNFLKYGASLLRRNLTLHNLQIVYTFEKGALLNDSFSEKDILSLCMLPKLSFDAFKDELFIEEPDYIEVSKEPDIKLFEIMLALYDEQNPTLNNVKSLFFIATNL